MKPPSTFRHAADLDALQERFARRVATGLAEHAGRCTPDVAERLRFAREQALQHARAARPASASQMQMVGSGAAALRAGNGRGAPPWLRLASVLPLVALIAGLLWIQQRHTHAQIAAAAEIDAELLSDALPPQAYRDAGFAEFLKIPRE